MSGPRILFTGGGTAGHVTPNLALMTRLAEEGWDLHYAGSEAGIERALVAPLGVPFHVLPTGKLRRYLSFENLLDAFRVLAGVFAGWRLCRRLAPAVVFSKGGFVSVPAVLGAALCGIPVVAHESDLSPGLATRLVARWCRGVCTNFPDTRVPGARALWYTGTPLREGLRAGDRARGLAHAGFSGTKPVLLVVGGSLGSRFLNGCVRAVLDELLGRFDVVHLCGRGQREPGLERSGYAQFEFVGAEYGDLLAAADLVVSRAGANGLFELLALRKPTLFVPLGTAASRGDQLENAAWAADRGYGRVVTEDVLDGARLLAELDALERDAEGLRERLAAFEQPDATALILGHLRALAAGQAPEAGSK
jgi:UDP-N-acetylglucosamine--N-acetylmuramyl-(pentapeptide) pyrophosphoryl-undecaprenol N-acetylglucosamine transferase